MTRSYLNLNKDGVMSKLEELIQKYCPDGVEYKLLGDVCDIHKGVQFNKSDMADEGSYPVMNGGINPSGYVEVFNEQENTITISQGGASAGYVNFLLSKFWLGAHCYAVKPSSCVLNRYLYHFIKQKELTLQQCQYGAGIPALAKGTVSSLEIPIPPLPVQEEIVRILDTFTELQAELQAELQKRSQQYNYYRDQLLAGDGSFKKCKLIDLLSQPITDGPHTTPQFFQTGIPFVSVDAVWDGRIHFEKKRGFISPEFDKECSKKYKPKRDDVFMVKSGSTTGKVAYVDTDESFNIWSPLAAMRVNDKTSSRYLFHLLQTSQVQEQVVSRSSQGSQPNLSMRVLEQFDVAVPSLPRQLEIVSLLDRFDTLTNDLTAGLPAEIEKRRQQYEYYRDKLLTFKRKEA